MPFVPGQSGNPSGRPKGFKGTAADIARRTKEFTTLVDYAMSVWQDPNRSHAERWEAFEWLSDRGMGRAVNVSEMSVAVEASTHVLPATWDSLSRADRERYLDDLVAGALPPGEQ